MFDLDKISAASARLQGVALETPVLPLASDRWQGLPKANVTLKLELFQQAGSFKARGAYLGIQALTPAERAAGVVAASGGNHALAVSWAARAAGIAAQITMPRATDPERIRLCQAMGATVTLHDDMAAAFAEMERIAATGATLMHPFEAQHMILGATTCGAEFLAQAPQIDTLVVPVGGGGLIAGMALAFKLLRPSGQVIGVEPNGADSTTRSLLAGHPVVLDKVDTIADSLGSPKALPLSFGVAADHVDRMVQIDDNAMREAMRDYADVLRIIAEPACAASLAAIKGPLGDDLKGRNVGIIACGSNIGMARYQALLS
ncbi:threonine/serine dehydratase [Yoonia sp. R2331]|uniref:threonine ammonia-lyase n=1 Tax=Yoonia sp. R2331 TaxID=3237238 RepID=UPI0034E5637E